MNQSIKKSIEKFCLRDDVFMSCAFNGNTEITEFFLSVVLPDLHLKVESVMTQKKFKNLFGNDIQVDILATDDEERSYDIEIQRTGNSDEIMKRARYYGAILDCSSELSGNYRNLKDKYIIFYTENDIMKLGKPIYHAERIVSGTNMNDGLHMIYLNMSYDGDDSFGKLNRDFKNPDYENMNFPVLQKTVKRLKTGEDETMSEIMEKLLEENTAQVAAQVTAQVTAQKQKENSIELYKNGVSVEIIAKSLKITEEEVKNVLSEAGLIQ